MAELMKDKYYNYETVNDLALSIQSVYSSFKVNDFVNEIIDKSWPELELKARMRRITIHLGKYLPAAYEKAIGILNEVVAGYPEDYSNSSVLCFADFVEVYGQDECYWDLSIDALAKYTQFATAEFAVRPFIINNEKRMMNQMAIWAKDKNHHIRRLASEGCRPALPWGQALTNFKKDPLPIINILEELKNDSSLYVRKSVANNLNDISKTHPDLVIQIAKSWYGKNEYTDWIIKHGCRTLLKKGNSDVLNIFGFVDTDCIQISDFLLDKDTIHIGESISFSFTIETEKDIKLRLEYGVEYSKAKEKRSYKIFQLSEILLKAKQKKEYVKTHSFADLSTRKHYKGMHSITLIVNGKKFKTLEFEVNEAK